MSGQAGSLQGNMNQNILADLSLDVDESHVSSTDDADGGDFLDLDSMGEGLEDASEGDAETTADGGEEGVEDAEGAPSGGDTETITVTTSKGREEIEISYTDRARIKRAYEQAAGADKLFGQYKFYREDATAARTELKAVKEEKTEAQSDWEALEKIRVEDGIEGAIEVLDGQSRPWYEIVNALAPKAAQFAKMTPEQRDAATPNATARKLEAENRKLKADLDAHMGKVKESELQQQVQSVQSTMDRVFSEVSFKGRLGNPHEEEKLDALVSTRVLAGIAELEERGVPLTEEAIRVVVTEAADIIPGVIRSQARKQAAAGQTAVSKAATQAAQKAAIKGVAAAKGGKTDVDGINWNDPKAVSDVMFQGFRAKKK